MKTLIICGSPRREGDSMALIKRLMEGLKGEVKLVRTYDNDIGPCVDCRYCWTHDRCAFKDFRDLDDYIRTCDNLVIASPIYFSEVTGSLLSYLSKFQLYWSNKYLRKKTIEMTPKRGGIILTYAGNCKLEKPQSTLKVLMNLVGVKEYFDTVVSGDTDNIGAKDDKRALGEIDNLAIFLNKK